MELRFLNELLEAIETFKGKEIAETITIKEIAENENEYIELLDKQRISNGCAEKEKKDYSEDDLFNIINFYVKYGLASADNSLLKLGRSGKDKYFIEVFDYYVGEGKDLQICRNKLAKELLNDDDYIEMVAKVENNLLVDVFGL